MNKPEIIKIELELKSSFPTVNCFLIKGDSITLIDAGKNRGNNWAKLNAILKENKLNVSDIEQVILTHEHTDHMGLVSQILENSDADILTASKYKRRITNYKELYPIKAAFQINTLRINGIPPEIIMPVEEYILSNIDEVPDVPEERVVLFNDDEPIDLGNITLTPIHTPGHCDTQYIFLDEINKICFGGDMILPLLPVPVLLENVDLPNTRLKSSLLLVDSYEKIKDLDIQIIHSGHGVVTDSLTELVHRQTSRLHARKEKCYELLKAGPLSIHELSQRMYGDITGPRSMVGIFMLFGYTDLLIKEGRVLTKTDENTSSFMVV